MDAALEFWQRVKEQKAESLEERQQLLVDMATEGKMERVVETYRTPEKVAQDYSEHYNVLFIKDGKSELKARKNHQDQ